MELINDKMDNAPENTEFFWAKGQQSLVVFRGEDVLTVIGLEKNSVKEALKRANEVAEKLVTAE